MTDEPRTDAPEPDCGDDNHHDDERDQPQARPERLLMIVVMVALSLITLINVVVRYLTNASFAFTEEVSSSLMLVLVLAGTASALVRNRHVCMSYLIQRRSATTRMRLERLAALMFLVAFGTLGWYGARQAVEDYRFDVVSAGLGIPEWTFSIWLPLMSLLICWRAVQALLRRPLRTEQPS